MVLPSAGLTPESPFYFLDTLGETIREFFTFKQEAKASLQVTFAAERISEIEKMLEKKGVLAEGIEVTQSRLKASLAKAVTIVVSQKSKGEDVSTLAKKFDDKFEALELSLVLIFKEQKRALDTKKEELKTRLIAVHGADDAAKEAVLVEELKEIEAQKELLDLKEKDIKDDMEIEEEKLEEQVGAQYAAEEAIQATEEEREKILSKATEKDIEIPTHAFAGFDSLLFQARSAFETGDFQKARDLAKQARYSREKLEITIEELEEKKREEVKAVLKKVVEEKQKLIDKVRKEGAEIPNSAFEKFDSILSQVEILIIIENYHGVKQLAEQTEEILKEVEIGTWNVFSSEKFGFEFRYPLSWLLGRNIEGEFQGYELVTITFGDKRGIKGYIDMQVTKRNQKLLPILQVMESIGSPRKFESYGNVAGVEAIKSHGYSGTAVNFTKGVSFFNIEARDTSDDELREVLDTFIFTQEEVKASDLIEPTLKEPRIDLIELSARPFPSATGKGYDIEFTWETSSRTSLSIRVFEAEEGGKCGPNSTWRGTGILSSFAFHWSVKQITKTYPSLTAGSKVCAQLWDDYYKSLIASDPILVVMEPSQDEVPIIPLSPKIKISGYDISGAHQICAASEKEKSEENYAPGELIINFANGLSVKDIKKFVQSGNLTVINTTFFEDPTEVLLKFNDTNSGSAVSTDEINKFLNEVRNEPYITSVEVSTFWHEWPLNKEDVDDVQRINEYGHFILTFSDIFQKSNFFIKYPKATLFIDGGESIERKTLDEKQVAILYNLHPEVSAVKSLRSYFNIGNQITIEDDYYPQTYDIIDLDHSQRNEEDTTYMYLVQVYFPGIYDSPESIRTVLSKFPPIDPEASIIRSKLGMLLIAVPEGEEGCWGDELDKHPDVEGAFPNYFMNII